MKILIPTCDKYRNLLEANKYSVDRFGGADLDVTILGFKKPDFDLGNWKFVSLGNDMGAKNFTNTLIPFFDSFNDEYFIYGHDDIVLTSKINFSFLNEIINTIESVPNFAKIWLLKAPPEFYGISKTIKNFNGYSIDEINQHAEYRLSLQYSIWKTSYFKKYLKPDLSPWEWELRNSAKHDGHSILIPNKNFVFGVGHLMKQGVFLKDKWKSTIFSTPFELNDVDVQNIENIFKKHGYV